MRIGVIFPQTEIGTNPADIAEFARTAEDLGYDHLLAYDHIVGVVPPGTGWLGYTYKDMFHEPFVLFGHLAAVTHRLELVSRITLERSEATRNKTCA